MAILGTLIAMIVLINCAVTIITTARLLIAIRAHGGSIRAGEVLLSCGNKMGAVLIAYGYSSNLRRTCLAIPVIGIVVFSIVMIIEIVLNTEAIKWSLIIIYIAISILFGIFIAIWTKNTLKILTEVRP